MIKEKTFLILQYIHQACYSGTSIGQGAKGLAKFVRCKGVIVYYVQGGGMGVLEGGEPFSKRLDFGDTILKMHKLCGGSKYLDTGLAFYMKVVKLYYD